MVALLAEGVDRNKADAVNLLGMAESPSSRRAWIEIDLGFSDEGYALVALLAEGVDRNSRP